MKKSYTLFIVSFSFLLFFAGTIDLNSLFNYSNQPIPFYINADNTGSNVITDEGATLGRVLFYDKNLSLTNSVSCGSCHKQALAFGDSDVQSVGHDGGLTGRHSTRLSSARFGDEEKFFWDERANTLEEQTTMPIQDHIEMGFSGSNGDPDIDSLIAKMENIYYYDELFNLAFGDQEITEERMQNALAQFVRSMQSFDSKYDAGRALAGNDNANFPNFTAQENLGKALYMSNTATGCNRCHRAPEFDIDPNSNNNGIIGIAGSSSGIDLTNERSPSLRDIVNNGGVENGPFMHDGSLATLTDVINHYNDIPNNPANTNLDNRLQGNGGDLNLSETEKSNLLAFLKTLGGSDLYTNEKWSNPFDTDGNLEILNGVLPIELSYFEAVQEKETIVLNWETYSELNNQGFEILYSPNASDWEVLDFVFGENEAAQYEYIHYSPSEGANYYRLKQIDFDGAFDLSEMRHVRLEGIDREVTLYPNPTHDVVTIKGITNPESVDVFNVEGQLIQQIDLSASNHFDLSALDSGVYYIRIMDGGSGQSTMTRVVKL